AVFAPVQRLAAIVVDEEHEPSYKQGSAPRYHARDVALARARLEGARVILGSATPSLETLHLAAQGRVARFELPDRLGARPPPAFRCHYCGHEETIPTACRMCGKEVQRMRGLGTQQLEHFVVRRFPAASIARMDLDTTSSKWAHHRILERMAQGKLDILLGTQ